MKRVLCVCLIIAGLLLNVQIAAEEAGLQCEMEENRLTVTAAAGSFESGTEVDLLVLEPGKNLNDMAEAGTVVCVQSVTAGRMGDVSVQTKLKNAAAGTYPVYLIPSGKGAVLSGNIEYDGGPGPSVHIVSAGQQDGAVVAEISVSQPSGKLLTAIYDEKGCMVALVCQEAQQNNHVSWNGNGSRIKVMLWNDLDGLKPLTAADESPL